MAKAGGMMASNPPVATAGAISPRTIGEALKSRSNNFDCLRLFAALLVIFSHSYPILYGKDSPDPLKRLTGYLSFGDLAVAVFFVISGLLVAGSFVSDPQPLRYLQKRSLRIFPALIICTLFCVMVVGPLFTSLGSSCAISIAIRRMPFWARNSVMWPTYELPGKRFLRIIP